MGTPNQVTEVPRLVDGCRWGGLGHGWELAAGSAATRRTWVEAASVGAVDLPDTQGIPAPGKQSGYIRDV